MIKKKKELRALSKGAKTGVIIEEEEEDDDYFGEKPKKVVIERKHPQEHEIPVGKQQV